MARRPSPTLANAVASGVRVARIEPLQKRIARNRRRFAAFMLVFTTLAAVTLFLALAVAVVFGGGMVAVFSGEVARSVTTESGRQVLVVVAIILGVASVIASWAWSAERLLHAETRLLRKLGAQMPKGGTLRPTKSALRDMAIAAGLPCTPRFYVIDTRGVNAFVLGRSIEKVRIGVTRGMLEKTSVDDQRAVFANLIARVVSQDTLWATASSALMGPIWAMRDYDLRHEPVRYEDSATMPLGRRRETDWRAGSLVLYGFAVVVTEVLSWYHREAAWTAAEKADAEGMMLLKDPRSMLGAIERVLERDNHVPTAGDAYSQLFFCWAGYGFAPEDDPEMRRVARLRETLGAEGAVYVPQPNMPGWPAAPVAPRIELQEGFERDGAGMYDS